MTIPFDRRSWLKAGAAGLAVGAWRSRSGNAADAGPGEGTPRRGLPDGWRGIRKIDVHNHVFDAVHRPGADWTRVESMIETADRLGIVRLCCSRPITGGVMAEIAEVRETNESILAAMRRYPDRISGFAFIQPGNGPAALDEIQRCVDAGMIGVKLYNQFRYSDPIVFPIAEKCIELRIPLLGHAGRLTDPKSLAAQPQTSDARDFCHLSLRYPELMLIVGHINGGGDWEWMIKGLRECPRVFVDTSGSVLENDTIDMCIRELGHERLLFATDQTMEGGVGKILGARMTEQQREDIFWRNADTLFRRRTEP